MTAPARTPRYYPAIDGLRAVAILLVVLGHARVPGFERGFIGVDMFFAISGFLITDRLVHSSEPGAAPGLVRFWAGRFRRLLPSIAVIVVVTSAATPWVLGPPELARAANVGVAASLFVGNYLFAQQGSDYFAAPLRDTPFLHLWSLAVEMQFYLVWPLLLGPAARCGARLTRRPARRVVAAGMGLVAATSLAASMIWSSRSPQWAFYGLPTRAYEFAIGGLAALFWVTTSRSRQATLAITLLGGLAIVQAMASTPIGPGFPSAWPLLSAGGTVLLIVGTARHGGAGRAEPGAVIARALSSRPMRALGRYSFAWYLWHWPAAVIVGAAWGDGWARVAGLASIVPAIAAHHLVERPIRHRPGIVGSDRRSLAVGAVAVGAALLACGALAAYAHVRLEDPSIARLARVEESFRIAGCTQDTSLFGEAVCIGGSTNPADPIVLLVGDSHAAQWAAAFSRVGRADHFRLAVRWRGDCSAFEFRTKRTGQSDGCRSFQQRTATLLDDPRVGAVVFAESIESRLNHGTPDQWFQAAAAEMAGIDRPTGLIVATATAGEPVRCLLRGGSETSCRVPRADAYAGVDQYAADEAELGRRDGAALLDVNDVVCGTDPCPLEYEDTLIPARADHLNRDFTFLMESRIRAFADRLLHEPTAR